MAGDYVKLRIPIDGGLSDRLQAFWRDIFGDAPDIEPAVLLGSETSHNTSDLYLVEEDGQAISTTMVTTCNALPELGGFGEVATLPSARGRGLATDLCGQSVEDFAEGGGRALFLGTVNPEAARIYHRLGWRKLASSIVWAAHHRRPLARRSLPGRLLQRVPAPPSWRRAAPASASRWSP